VEIQQNPFPILRQERKAAPHGWFVCENEDGTITGEAKAPINELQRLTLNTEDTGMNLPHG
jgi:hypothetical protein